MKRYKRKGIQLLTNNDTQNKYHERSETMILNLKFPFWIVSTIGKEEKIQVYLF